MKKLRPLLACTAALASLPASAAPAAEQSGTSTPVVETTEGKLQGQSSKGVYSFLGIHYGADTSGKNRFLPPKQPAASTGVKAANKMGDSCPQPPLDMPGEMHNVLSFSDLPTSQDCLVVT